MVRSVDRLVKALVVKAAADRKYLFAELLHVFIGAVGFDCLHTIPSFNKCYVIAPIRLLQGVEANVAVVFATVVAQRADLIQTGRLTWRKYVDVCHYI